MSEPIIIHKGRTNVITASLGFNVANDVLTSEIRSQRTPSSLLIATWTITYVIDGLDGEIVLTLDNSALNNITVNRGFMDIKRVTNGEPISVFDTPLEVIFKDVVTI
jgi:hypothetical protein